VLGRCRPEELKIATTSGPAVLPGGSNGLNERRVLAKLSEIGVDCAVDHSLQ